MKVLVLAVIMLFSSVTLADVLMVNIYQPLPGGAAKTMAYAQEAREIHTAMGASVSLGSDLDGNMHYAMAFANWESWGKFSQSMAINERWSAFQAKINASPSATQIANYLLNEVTPGASAGAGGVYQVFIWEPNDGQVGMLMQGGIGAKPIHEKAGARIAIYRDQLNRMHYVMSYDNWEAWGKGQDTPNPEFSAYMQAQSANPAGRLVQVYTAQSL